MWGHPSGLGAESVHSARDTFSQRGAGFDVLFEGEFRVDRDSKHFDRFLLLGVDL